MTNNHNLGKAPAAAIMLETMIRGDKVDVLAALAAAAATLGTSVSSVVSRSSTYRAMRAGGRRQRCATA